MFAHEKKSSGVSSATTESMSPTSSRSGLMGLGYEAALAALSPLSGASKASPSAEKSVAKSQKPFTVSGSGQRRVFNPKQPNGKTLYFFFGYTGSSGDRSMRDSETADVEDDVLYAAAQGFTVVYDLAGTHADFYAALYDSTCYGIYWSGHGYMDGDIETSDGLTLSPSDVDTSRRASGIQYLVFAACGSGIKQAAWQRAMGPQCKFQGWVDITYVSETNDFTSTDMQDSLSGHNGTDEGMELRDYINEASRSANGR